jgi:inosine-uridine nucleoside N-ribohydrolase
VALLRRTLAAQPDGSVHIAQVGFSTNLARLLESPADADGTPAGIELVRLKVRQLVVMAGAFDQAGPYRNHLEFNVIKDLPAAKTLAEKWPGPVVWSGFEIGMGMRFPSTSIREDNPAPIPHLIKEAYVAYCGERGENPTWDLTCPLFIAFPDRGYFGLSEPGRVEISNEGKTTFTAASTGPHRYLTHSPLQAARTLEAFVQLCAMPPLKAQP